MSPAHSSHSLSPTQSLGPTPDSDSRIHPFPTPPNSLPQHHHSPSNCATPHSTQSSNQHVEYSVHIHPQSNGNGSTALGGSQTVPQSYTRADDTCAARNSPTNMQTTMIRSAMNLERQQHLHHYSAHQQRSPSQMSSLMNHHHIHHHTGVSIGQHETRSEDCDDLDINNLMPIGPSDFGTELCEVRTLLEWPLH